VILLDGCLMSRLLFLDSAQGSQEMPERFSGPCRRQVLLLDQYKRP
jgi:hypothetical protein